MALVIVQVRGDGGLGQGDDNIYERTVLRIHGGLFLEWQRPAAAFPDD